MNQRHRNKRGTALRVPLLLGAVTCLALSSGTAADDQTPSIEDTRAALEQYVETRRVIAEQKREWAFGKEMLEERIDVVKRRIEAMRANIAETEASLTEADGKRAELFEENERLKESATALTGSVLALETRTRELLARLPEVLRERVAPLAQRIPTDPETTSEPLGSRFQNVIGVLNAVNKFNREITVTSEVRELPGGTTAEVTALYVGISQAYYVSADRTAAGTGQGTAEGWVWTPDNASAEVIAAAIGIMNNEQVAGFVELPLQVTSTVEEAR